MLVDEAYHHYAEEPAYESVIPQVRERPALMVARTFSKIHGMAGVRLGYAVAHPEVIAAAGKIQSHSTSNPSSISQAAALAALNGADEDAERMHDAYRERRAYLVPALNAIDGFCCSDPDGAFYVFPEVRRFFGRSGIHDSQSFAAYLLDEARVVVVPGSAFGADDYVRISYATSMERIREGIKRLTAALGKL